MVGASKILTVSYGTFSCTLEGFDDPFSTMKAIAEYFRDLAAEDRYFGAEPPTPDAEMLHRIAEREIQRRVEAKIQQNGIVLRAHDGEATPPAEPAPLPVAAPKAEAPRPAPPRPEPAPAARATPPAAPPDDFSDMLYDDDLAPAAFLDPTPAAAPVAEVPAEESVAAKLLRIRAAVAEARAAERAPAAAPVMEAVAEEASAVEDGAEAVADEDASAAQEASSIEELAEDIAPVEEDSAEDAAAEAGALEVADEDLLRDLRTSLAPEEDFVEAALHAEDTAVAGPEAEDWQGVAAEDVAEEEAETLAAPEVEQDEAPAAGAFEDETLAALVADEEAGAEVAAAEEDMLAEAPALEADAEVAAAVEAEIAGEVGVEADAGIEAGTFAEAETVAEAEAETFAEIEALEVHAEADAEAAEEIASSEALPATEAEFEDAAEDTFPEALVLGAAAAEDAEEDVAAGTWAAEELASEPLILTDAVADMADEAPAPLAAETGDAATGEDLSGFEDWLADAEADARAENEEDGPDEAEAPEPAAEALSAEPEPQPEPEPLRLILTDPIDVAAEAAAPRAPSFLERAKARVIRIARVGERARPVEEVAAAPAPLPEEEAEERLIASLTEQVAETAPETAEVPEAEEWVIDSPAEPEAAPEIAFAAEPADATEDSADPDIAEELAGIARAMAEAELPEPEAPEAGPAHAPADDDDAALVASAGLSPEDEERLLAELRDLERQVAQVRRSESEGRAILMAAPDEDEGSVSRLVEAANEKLEGAESRRKFSAISHLRAAVAATVADRKMRGTEAPALAQPEAPTAMERYREDLSQAVRPRRPAAEGAPATQRPVLETRPAPLVLVSEQRVDRPAGAATPIRPRRISVGSLAARDDMAAIEPDEEDEEDLAQEALEDSRSFAEFAERIGARGLAELLEAAAAYTAAVEGKPSFSRPQLMRKVAHADFNREDGLRSFGMLLRQGKIQKIGRGEFAIASTSKYIAEARRAAQ